MILPLQKFSTLLENMAAGVQGGSSELVDLSVGSVLRAVLEACAAVALWMQWLILQVLTMTRAATSTGEDLDSWMADFGLVRLPGSVSSGQVTFARYTPGVASTIPVGSLVQTVDGSQSFVIIKDATNPAWNNQSFSYDLAAKAVSVTVPASANLVGFAGNVQAGSVGVLATAIPGVDIVSNTGAFGGGANAESDVAFRARFTLYINSRSAGTLTAIDFAIASTQQGLRYAVLEETNPAGLAQPGFFWAIVDDGTGSPPATLLTSVSAAIDMVRPIGATFAVTGPGVVSVSVQLNIVTSNPLTKPAVETAIQGAIAAWIAGLPIGGTLALSKIEALAHGADTSVISVLAATINGGQTDLTVSASQVLVVASIAVE